MILCKRIFLFAIFFGIICRVDAQYTLTIVQSDTSQKVVVDFPNRAKQQEVFANLVAKSLNDGFRLIKTENDTLLYRNSTIFLGHSINFQISTMDFPQNSKLRFPSSKEKMNKPLAYKQVKEVIDQMLTFGENNGYPFISIVPEYQLASDSVIDLKMVVEMGPLIRYDSIDIRGNSKISARFISAYLGIKKGRLFNQKDLKNVDKRLQKLSFVQPVKSSDIAFLDSNMLLILYLNKKNSSQFDGIVGILPQSGNNSKPLITGDVKLNLQNLFNQGEQFVFNWKRSDPLSQDLLINGNFPYIASSRYGALAGLKLIKKDTTTLTTTLKIGGQLFLSAMNNVSAYFENSSSKLLSTTSAISSGTIGSNVDFAINRYGLFTEIDLLDDPWIPTKGIRVFVDANIGTRKTITNIAIPIEYYSGINKSETQIKIVSLFDGYYPLFKKLIFNFSNRTNFLSGENHFENEMFRFGGLTSFRGFNEESISATFVNIANVELRWLLDRRTFFYGFWNGAYYEKKMLEKFVHDTPYGFGVGLSFDTPAGIFNITYALGKEFNNPIQLKYGKIHFGIVARF